MSENKIPKCPNCNNKMVQVWWYREPIDVIEQYANEKAIFYKGLEYKPIKDFDDPKRISYHCYNCNRSYTRDLTNYEIEEDTDKIMIQARKDMIESIDYLAREVIKELDEDMIEHLKQKSNYIDEHFGFGLYIRNNFIYENPKLKFRVEADEFSHKIFDRIIEILIDEKSDSK